MTTRVMHIELGRQLYGGAKQVEYLIRALDSSTFSNLLVCAEDSAIAKLKLSNCRILPLPYAGDVDFRFPFRLHRYIRQHQPHIVHVHSRRGADVWGGVVAHTNHVPAVCTRRVDNRESSLAKLKYRHYDAVVSISDGVRQVVSEHCRGSRQEVIHSAVNLTDFCYTDTRRWLEYTYNIPPGTRVIANFAQLIPRKGQAELIAAMGKISAHHDNVVCLLFGKGKQLDHYQQLIDSSGLNDKVRLCGFTDDVPRILPAIDIMAHPAHAEGLGVSLLQGAACKRPMVSCPVGGIPEVVIENKTGLLVPPGDSTALADALLRLLDDPATAQRLGAAAYNHIEAHFTPDVMARRYAQLYHALMTKS